MKLRFKGENIILVLLYARNKKVENEMEQFIATRIVDFLYSFVCIINGIAERLYSNQNGRMYSPYTAYHQPNYFSGIFCFA